MLMKTTGIYHETPSPQDEHVTGQFIAKNKRDKYTRASLAAGVRDGHGKIDDLTIAQLARLFRTTAYLVKKARRPPPLVRPRESLAEMFARSSSAERREMARSAGVDLIWDECVEPLIAE
jgi:hypothetical protein